MKGEVHRLTRDRRTGKARMVKLEPQQLPAPPEPPQQRAWPYEPAAETLLAWINTAICHHVAIRATGSVPDVGGPSVPIEQLPAAEQDFRNAAAAAESFWPNARQFDLIMSDLEYKGIDSESEGLDPGMNRLRNAAVVTTFTVTDRGAIAPPSSPAA